MKKEFQKHTKRYLEINKSRGLGNGYTINTYVCKYCPIGYGGRYTDCYAGRIYNDLFAHKKQVFAFVSARGGYAWYPKNMLRGENKKKYKIVMTMHKLNPETSYHSIWKIYNKTKK